MGAPVNPVDVTDDYDPEDVIVLISMEFFSTSRTGTAVPGNDHSLSQSLVPSSQPHPWLMCSVCVCVCVQR